MLSLFYPAALCPVQWKRT